MITSVNHAIFEKHERSVAPAFSYLVLCRPMVIGQPLLPLRVVFGSTTKLSKADLVPVYDMSKCNKMPVSQTFKTRLRPKSGLNFGLHFYFLEGPKARSMYKRTNQEIDGRNYFCPRVTYATCTKAKSQFLKRPFASGKKIPHRTEKGLLLSTSSALRGSSPKILHQQKETRARIP